MTLYDRLILEIFRRHFDQDQDTLLFTRDEMSEILDGWGETIRNLGDVLYSYRGGRRELPFEITSTGNWVIEGRERGHYAFRRLARSPYIDFPESLVVIDILDATPEIVVRYSRDDEQGLLTKLRHNRLIDTFLGVTCYHLQGHLRGTVAGRGQVELDDLYLAVDTDGTQYAIPVEAKTHAEPLGIVQLANMNAYSRTAFPDLIIRPIAVKSLADGSIICAELTPARDSEEIAVVTYKRYRLVRDKSIEA